MYVKASNEVVEIYPYSIGQLRKDNPNVSFPKSPDNTLLAQWNVYPVQSQNPPSFNLATENCERVSPTLQNGVWTETWSVTAASAEEIARRTEEMSVQVRTQRNALLVQSDWTQGKDIPESISTLWAIYRQALRDITTQGGFPWDIAWPTKPE
jgi:hypothetical protein